MAVRLGQSWCVAQPLAHLEGGVHCMQGNLGVWVGKLDGLNRAVWQRPGLKLHTRLLYKGPQADFCFIYSGHLHNNMCN